MTAPARPEVNAALIEVPAGSGFPSGFQTRYRQLGPLLGSELLGATVYESDPGERNGPYHYEIGNEECLLVLMGTPTLRHPEGRDVLAVGDMVMFPEGTVGASPADQRVTGDRSGADPVNHAGALRLRVSGQRKVSTFAGVFPIGATVDYWDGESSD